MWANTPRLDASLTNAGSGACSSTITGQAASRTILSISSERMLGALPESDERDVGSLPGGHGADVFDVDLARDHLVAKSDHDRRHQRQAVLALVCDQDAQMLGLAVAHELPQPSIVARHAAFCECHRQPLPSGACSS